MKFEEPGSAGEALYIARHGNFCEVEPWSSRDSNVRNLYESEAQSVISWHDANSLTVLSQIVFEHRYPGDSWNDAAQCTKDDCESLVKLIGSTLNLRWRK